MDILIAYKHDDMFRLDGEYYKEIKNLIFVDNRYGAGKYGANIKFKAES